MTIRHNEANLILDLSNKGGVSDYTDLFPTFNHLTVTGLIKKELLARHEDMVILTDKGIDVANLLK